jgi:hypothetical protein
MEANFALYSMVANISNQQVLSCLSAIFILISLTSIPVSIQPAYNIQEDFPNFRIWLI